MSNNYFKHGSYNAICDVCGRKFKADQLKLRWDGFMVCSEDYEQRHPQDLIKVYERPDILPYTRDEPADVYVGNVTSAGGASCYAGSAEAGTAITGSKPILF